jgi:putative ubiquitin-RnfH superfamily antitoxin RatB of RatAB toxin-antitoxin module
MSSSEFEVEFVFALAERQLLRCLTVPDGSTVKDVISHSRVESDFPDIDMTEFETGIWGRQVGLQQRVKAGDRVEIYRPLELEPREARRQLALVGRTMRSERSD